MAVTINRCACGKRIGKCAMDCSTCNEKKLKQRYAEAAEHVKNGCPQCGLPLRRNLALKGWWQCSALGVPEMREEQYKNAKTCSFQTFTEN